MQGDLTFIDHDVRELKSETLAIGGHMLAAQQDVADIYAVFGRHEARLDRIERRVELREPALT